MSVEIGPKAYTLVAPKQTWQGYASCLRNTQLVESLGALASLHQCSGFLVVGQQVPQIAEHDIKERSSCLQ